jgi:methylenetetrahydrofolate dehydrogenase (NADP+)/methenyltetrahydrofolate cyclohydrolase
MTIDGKKIASEISENLKKCGAPNKFLAAFLVGDDAASVSFLKQKERAAKELGIDFRIYRFPEKTTQDELRKEILKITGHKNCGGAIVQLPLPTHINRQYVLNVIPREKDIDVLGERALGAFYAGRNPILPPAVGVVEEILKRENLELKNKKIAVVGLGFLVGKPISEWLKGKCAEIYLLDIGSDLDILKNADVAILGTGKAGLIKPKMVKENAFVIDFGYSNENDDKIRGDFEPPASETNITYTPTPGGTGPILVAKLFENFYRLAIL